MLFGMNDMKTHILIKINGRLIRTLNFKIKMTNAYLTNNVHLILKQGHSKPLASPLRLHEHLE